MAGFGIRHLLVLSLVLLVVFTATGISRSHEAAFELRVPFNTEPGLALKASNVEELKEQLVFARTEADKWRLRADDARAKQVEAERLASMKSNEVYLPPPPTSDPTDVNGSIFVLAAAAYCNCPVLVNGGNATKVLEKANVGAYTRAFPNGINGCVDATAKVSQACNGLSSCAYKVEQLAPVKGCPQKFVVDYSCDGKPARHESIYNLKPGNVAKLDCNKLRPVPPVIRQVNGVKPVKFVHNGMSIDVWPVGFTVPGHRYVGSLPWKEQDFADLIPGNGATYTHKQNSKGEPDTEYFQSYKRSFYCVTRKKKGWDCLRHYEILAAGCVPYFVDLPRLPATTMAFFPRDLVWEAMNLPGVKFNDEKGAFWYKESFSIDHDVFNTTRYYELATKIQAHARRHLTSEAMAQYILRALEVSGGPTLPKRVLFINHCYHDFMADSLWSGFKELELKGVLEKVTDVVPPAHLSLGGKNSNWGKLYGHGNCRFGRKVPLMTSAATLKRSEYYQGVQGWGNHRSHNYWTDDVPFDPEAMPARIAAKEFDVVVYATPTRTSAWLDDVAKYYPPTSVAFLSGNDNAENLDSYAKFSSMGRMFVRELYDEAGGEIENTRVCYEAPGVADSQGLDCCAMQDGGARIMWSSSIEDKSKWIACGKENDKCECATEVRFGDSVHGQWAVMDLNLTKKELICKNRDAGGIFPDPAVGLPKTCQCREREDYVQAKKTEAEDLAKKAQERKEAQAKAAAKKEAEKKESEKEEPAQRADEHESGAK
ncbi:hypothetical protein DIPPA_09796 [Diplonema papillatum]|nr:hypothetical protein DIPPA_09796 [Diplonema papillatum]